MPRTSLWLRAGFLLMLVNSGYLFTSAAPTVFYAANLLLHVGVGTLLVLVAVKALPQWVSGRSAVWWLSTVLLGASAGTGLALVVLGNGTATGSLLAVHIGSSALGALSVLLWRREALLSVATAIAVTMPLVALVASSGHGTEKPNQRIAPLSMAGEAMGGAEGLFFPSAAETAHGGTIPSEFFMGSEACGRCHTDIYQQWESSAHRKASFNNQWYRKSVEYMQSVVGVTPSKWCAGCHDHALLFSGHDGSHPSGRSWT